MPKVKLHCTLQQGMGIDDIVEVLIKYCAQTRHDQDLEEGIEPVKEMLRMMNKEKDTALHEAVRYNHLEVVNC
jgi:ankyrin repeat protein